jgi:hypothetical protein
MGKTWKQKLDGGKPAHVEVLNKPFGGAPPGAKMLVGTPRLVDDYMRRVPEGQARTVAQMRADLAKEHGADIACPLSTASSRGSPQRRRWKTCRRQTLRRSHALLARGG